MSEVAIDYRGNRIATLGASGSKTLLTAGKFCDDDISVSFNETLAKILMRPDTEFLQRYTHDSLLVEDDGITIPAYSSSSTTILAAANLTPTITLDYANYNYYAVEAFLTIPTYNTDTPAKGRNEYGIGAVLYELLDVPANTFIAANGTKYTSRAVGAVLASAYRLLYWSSASALGVYTATSYGVAQVAAAPTVSSGKWTIKAPSVAMRGSTTYLTSAVWGTITDIRRQYVIEVYRAPKDNLNVDAWGLNQLADKILSDVNNNNWTLRSIIS